MTTFCRFAAILFLASFSLSMSTSLAASVSNLELVPDGSALPPGDRLDLKLWFDGDEREVEVVVRGFRLSGEGQTKVQPLSGDEETLPGALTRSVFSRNPQDRTRVVSIVVPYSALRLPPGTHTIAYEVVVRVQRQVVFSLPTQPTQVIVTDGTREEMTVRRRRVEITPALRSQTVRVAGPRTRGGNDAVPIVGTTEIETPILEQRNVEETVSVSIPGEYRREELENQEASVPSEASSVAMATTDDVASLEGQSWSPLETLLKPNERQIWFATNRVPTSSDLQPFSGKLDTVNHYGVCIVNIPVQNHRRGNIESPSWWETRNAADHFTIEQVASLNADQFAASFGDEDTLLFIHGYYNSFEDAIFRTAQLHHDLDFPGRSVAFSWPSAGKLTEYESDQKMADKSVTALVEMLTRLSERPDRSLEAAVDSAAPKIHIIAHSMGNRLLLQALYELQRRPNSAARDIRLGQVVLAAPDVGAIMFNNLSPYAAAMADQLTYYYCGNDSALAASQQVNQYEPVGLLPYFDEGICTIDAGGVGTSFLSHGYYASAREVLEDIELMLQRGWAPRERMPPLATETEVYGHPCWAFASPRVIDEAAAPTE